MTSRRYEIPPPLLGLCIFCLLTRLGAVCLWPTDLSYDRDAYLGIAQNIALGRGFSTPGTDQPTAYRPPLYPCLLSIPLVLGASPACAVGCVNTLASLALTLATYYWACCQGLSAGAAWWAAIIVCIDPMLWRYSAQPMTETCFTSLVMLALVSLWAARHTSVHGPDSRLEVSHSVRRAVLSGGVWGMAALCRPTIWPCLLWVTVCWRRWHSLPRGWPWFWLGWMLAVSPWLMRNLFALQAPIVTTTHGGYTLLLANNPTFYDVARAPWGTRWEESSLTRWQDSLRAELERDLGPKPGEIATDRWMTIQAWHHMKQDPTGLATAVIYRVRSFWAFTPRTPLAPPLRLIVGAWYAILITGGLISWFWSIFQRSPAAWLSLGLLLSLQLIHLFYWTDSRMRSPLHPLLAIMLVQGLNSIMASIRQPR